MMQEIIGNPKPIGERERRKNRDPVKKRKRKLSEREEGETRVRNRVKKRKRREREEGETKNRKRVKKGKPKLSEKRLAKTRLSEKRLETETKLDPQPKKKKEKAKKYKKKYCDMTKDEVVNLCSFLERPRARLVVNDLRNYLIQDSESEHFDCDVFPGHFSGVTSVCPVVYCDVNIYLQNNLERLAIAGITKYNLANNETEYEVVDVDKVNVYVGGMQCTYFVTFDARDVKANDGALKTFQAIVEANEHGFISYVRLCRPKLS